ncbi:hypothetical protein B0F90DRAFT_1925060 [Multifurca ochricompacta]|uniref:Uncharacterized protein n=1 Tax=Multifurca ochricompacta TaxID=376703 RepID=A0AAD4M7D4_9AGAM|nr:hypothetical protein B0F90DRAFT_1925060 [Multifurca ochricompacta]
MSQSVPEDSLLAPLLNSPISSHNRLHRRSSCSSIPRSVNVCSSIWAFDKSSEDLRIPVSCGDMETYMAPLLRSLDGIGEAQDDVPELAHTSPSEGFTSQAKATHYDDSLSESLSNYQFDVAEQQSPEHPNVSEGNLSTVQAPETTRYNRSFVSGTPSTQEAPQPPCSSHTPSGLGHILPPAPLRVTRPISSSRGTQPLQIDHLKKRLVSGSSPQRAPRLEGFNWHPSARPIHKAATQVNLREAYKRTSPLEERRVQLWGVTPIVQPSLHPLPETPSASQEVPITTLFSTGLIPLEFETSLILPILQSQLPATAAHEHSVGHSAVHLRSREGDTGYDVKQHETLSIRTDPELSFDSMEASFLVLVFLSANGGP